MQANEKTAEIFKGHPCWQEELKPAAKVTDKDLSEADKKAAKEQEEARAAQREQERLKLLKKCQDMGITPNARTGIPKLTKLIEDATAAKAAGGGDTAPASGESVI